MVTELNEQNFNKEALEATLPVVVKVYAEWCPPCKQMAPGFEAVAKQYADTVKFFEVNADNARGLAVQLSITSIPTTLFIKNGQILGKELGYLSKDALVDKIEALIKG